MAKKNFLLCFFALSQVIAFSQTKCIDSFENRSLYESRFKYILSSIPSPVISTDSSVFYNASLSVIKKNRFNNIEWIKSNDYFMAVQQSTQDNGVVGTFENDQAGIPGGIRGLFKLSSTGNLLWSRRIQISTRDFNNYGYLSNLQKGRNDDIILFNARADQISLTVLNSDASVVRLSKNFKAIFSQGETFASGRAVFANNSIFIFAITQSNQFSPVQLLRCNLMLIKLNYTTGDLERISYLHSNDQHLFPSINLQGVFSPNLNAVVLNNSSLLFSGRKYIYPPDNNRFYTIKLDTNFKVIKYNIYESPVSHSYSFSDGLTPPAIDKNGNSFFAVLKDSISRGFSGTSNECYYFTTDSNLNLSSQKHLNIAEAGLNSRGYSLNAVPLLKLNNNAEVIFHTEGSEADSLLHIVELPSKLNDLSCIGNNYLFITTETPTISVLTAPILTAISPATISLSNYNVNIYNTDLEERKFCVQKSICDTIKIKGSSAFCLPNDTATFTLFKNPQCLRKTKWLTDTAFVKIMAQPNDTTIKVKFLRPYSGYIHATFEGCVLQDSLFIQVAAPKRKLFLGKDSVLCPGKTITLNAGAGFKTYRWQDGNSSSSFTVSTSGNYFVEATDSCNNVFRDSITIKPMDATLNLVYPNPVCKYDTASIQVNPLLESFVWTPAISGSYQNNTLKFFPESSTLYNVTAEGMPGCLLTDTVLIKVENCPIYIYIPNAFSPNNDGNNDVFKPLVSGRLLNYWFNIYNRYGQVIFSTTEVGKGWDGKIGGLGQNTGSFVWTCSYQFINKPVVSKKGTVLLVR